MPKGIKGFQKGHKSYLTKEQYSKIGQSHSKRMKGKRPAHLSGFPKGHTGFQTRKQYDNPERNRKISQSLTGRVGFMRGKKRSNEFKRKVSEGHKRLVMLGIHHALNGGVTPLLRMIRQCLKYKEWRRTILARDKWKCTQCKEGGRLQVDHFPRSFRDIFYDNKIKSIEDAERCEEMWMLSNGRTLCIKCHSETPTWGVHYRLPIYRLY